MKQKVYCLYDTKALAYLFPMFFQHDRDAIDAIQETLRDRDSKLSKHAADFTLFKIAEFSPITGRIESFQSPDNMGNLLALKEQQPEVQQ